MLRLIHTSDWHLGHELYGHDRMADAADWLRQLRDIVAREQPDALIVSGDIYHTAAPSNSVMTHFHSALAEIRRACPTMTVVVTAGNHDSPSRLEVSGAVWRELGVEMAGTVRRDADGQPDLSRHIIDLRAPDGSLRGLAVALPYISPGGYPATAGAGQGRDDRRRAFMAALGKMLERRMELSGPVPVVMSAHLAVAGCDMSAHDEQGGLEYMQLDDITVDFDYLALGHIHCRQTFSRGNARARYCGTPAAVSFDERAPHSVSLVEIDSHGSVPRITPVELMQRRPLLTLPAAGEDPLTFDAALDLLAGWESEAFLRLRVAVGDVAPPHAIERACRAAASGRGRFCAFKWIRPERDNAGADAVPRDIDEFKALTPGEVARRYYADRTGQAMPDDLSALLDEIMEHIESHPHEAATTCN